MKNLTKIFMAVAVAFFAFSCVADATEELGVKLNDGKAQTTTLTFSLEESRTHLGNKAGDLYPLYWSEGDAIAVNGVASTPLTAELAGSAATTFEFPATLERPYHVVYPAPAEVAVAEGEGEETEAPAIVYPVTFLASQPYTTGTFAPQAAPMYAYAEAESGAIQLQHLTGILRLAPKGNGEKVTSIVVTSEKGAIAGPFTIDCATGTLAAQEGASNTVVVTFAEPLVLGAEAQPVYVAVPAGSKGFFAITIVTEAHGKMTAKFNSDDKAVSAGKVREFGEFVYAENANDSEEVLIESKEDLIQFAQTAASFYPHKVAKVVATIDMTGVEWTPIEGFSYTFDGGSEQGCEIKNLSAPLFGTTSATIQNVKLTGVNINETTRHYVGSIACHVTQGAVHNCYAEGQLVMNNNNKYTAEDTHVGCISVAGLVGRSEGGEFYGCYNKVAVTLTSSHDTTSEKALSTMISGVAGHTTAGSTFENCTNDAKILYNGTATHSGKGLYICGIVASSNENNDTKLLKNLENTANGTIEFAADAVATGSVYMRGCVGVIYDGQTEVADITNKGSINFLGTCNGSNLSISGVGGNLGASKEAHRLNNHGSINVLGAAPSVSSKAARFGGIASETAGNVTHKIYDSHNYGTITVKATTALNTPLIGGFCGYNGNGTIRLEDCTNEGTVIIPTGAAKFTTPTIGGMVGYISTSFQFVDSENKGAVKCEIATTSNTYIGGFVAHTALSTASSLTGCVNSGAVSHTGSVGNNMMMAGFVAYHAKNAKTISFTNCENKGEIKSEANVPGSARVGGYVGATYAQLQITACVNSGAITGKGVISGDSDAKLVVSGFVADSEDGTPTVTFVGASEGVAPSKNTGTITLTGNICQYARASGFGNVDHTSGKMIATDVINEGQIIVKDLKATLTATSKGYIQVGGISSYHVANSVLTNVKNKGNITVENSTLSYMRVGGISANGLANSSFSGRQVNIGNITVTNSVSKVPTDNRVAGLVAGTDINMTGDCYCDINAVGMQGYVGLVTGSVYNDNKRAKDCNVGGNIYLETKDTIVEEERNDEGDVVKPAGVIKEPIKTPITSDNYVKYLYGSIPADKVFDANGCQYLATKPVF